MFRRLVKFLIVVFIVGAAINIAVCWGIALVQSPRSPSKSQAVPLDEAQLTWEKSTARVWESLDEPVGERGRGCGRRWQVVMKPLRATPSIRDATIKPTDEFGVLIESQYGWPWPALRSGATLRLGPQSLIAIEHGRWIGTQDELLRHHDLRALAWGPMWPGLAANSGVFALAAMVLLWIPVARRRRRRRLSGQCVRCGYDLRSCGGHTKCPECGSK